MNIKINPIIKFNSETLYLYLLFIPFLMPLGYKEYSPFYKIFSTIWLYIAVLLFFVYFILRFKTEKLALKKYFVWLVIYYGVFFVETLLIQGGIYEGFQKLFIAPFACLICAVFLKDRPITFLRCVANILILNFFLNATIFSPAVIDYFGDNTHIIFLGHVQVASSMGVLGIYISYLLKHTSECEKNRAFLLFILSVVTMLISQTAASAIILLSMFVMLCISKFKLFRWLLTLQSSYYMFILLVLNAFLLYHTNFFFYDLLEYGVDTSLNGRTFIWAEAFRLLENKLLFGYGAYGVLIEVFWGGRMNYAHNELLQKVLDGGIVLLVFFLIIIFACLRNVKYVKDKKDICVTNMMLVSMILVMLIESVTEYYYFLIFLSIVSFLPEITSLRKMDEV